MDAPQTFFIDYIYIRYALFQKVCFLKIHSKGVVPHDPSLVHVRFDVFWRVWTTENRKMNFSWKLSGAGFERIYIIRGWRTRLDGSRVVEVGYVLRSGRGF